MNEFHLQSVRPYAYYNTGGMARYFYCPTSVDSLQNIIRSLKNRNIPFYYLGSGTNSLLSDRIWQGAIIWLGCMRRIEVAQEEGGGFSLYCEAGVSNTEISNIYLNRRWQGGGWMNFLPGQCGASVRMNAKCFGSEMSKIVKKVHVIDSDCQIRVIENEGSSVFRGYKDTIFMDNDWVISAVEFGIQADQIGANPDTIRQKMYQVYTDRNRMGHFAYPSSGCVFKNDYDVGVSSGFLLDKAGCKGLQMGGAAVSDLHANFVYNNGASSDDIVQLTLAMRERVFNVFGVWLEYELEFLGDFFSWQTSIHEKRAKLENSICNNALAKAREEFNKGVSN